MQTGSDIYTAAKLLSAVPVEAKLCRPLAELFLDWKKIYDVRIQMLLQSPTLSVTALNIQILCRLAYKTYLFALI